MAAELHKRAAASLPPQPTPAEQAALAVDEAVKRKDMRAYLKAKRKQIDLDAR